MPRDYYEVLGVSRDADDAEIKKAFRRLARELHPDVNSHDPAGRGEVQGGRRGLRGAVRRRPPRDLRPLRPRGPAQRRLRAELRRVRLGRGHLRGVLRRRRRSAASFGGGGARPAVRRSRAATSRSAAEIDARRRRRTGEQVEVTLRGRRPLRALPRQRRRAGNADRDLPTLRRGRASCARSRARRSARWCARSSATLCDGDGQGRRRRRARCAAVAAASSSARRSRSTSRRASTTVSGSASPVAATPASAAGPPATCTC